MAAIEKFFGEDEIKERVERLAQDIAGTVPGDVVIVGLLKGCFVFLADLVRALHRVGANPEVEFMRLSSYGLEKTSGGLVHLIGDVSTDVSGRKILLVDDIVDTGRSVAYARAMLEQRCRRLLDLYAGGQTEPARGRRSVGLHWIRHRRCLHRRLRH